jgi:hypothetical protein
MTLGRNQKVEAPQTPVHPQASIENHFFFLFFFLFKQGYIRYAFTHATVMYVICFMHAFKRYF